jgi:acylphosphatase
MPTNLICVHLHISGRVQGVGFRASLQEKAHALRLQDWVRMRCLATL